MTDMTQSLIDQVRQAAAQRQSLNIVGGNSKAFLGRASQGESIHLGSHSGIVSYEPVELVMTARAGTPLADIEAALCENNQTLAFEPPHFDGKATLGGTLACNLSGPGRPWNGSVRDMVLGLRMINGRGEHLRFGGQVMKNVAGYDVSRMQAGAMGTLGIITEISMKVMPRPASTLTLVQECSASEAIHKMNQYSGQPKPLTGAFWWKEKLYLRLSGTESAVTGTAKQWGGELLGSEHTLWQSLNEQRLSFFENDEPLWRFSIKPTALHWKAYNSWLIDWGGAQRWLSGVQDYTHLEQQARSAGGQVTLYRGGDRHSEVHPTLDPGMQQLHVRLKDAMDPNRIFNIGRLYSWM